MTRKRRSEGSAWTPYLYVLPAFVFFIIVIGIPLLQTAYYSVWNWNGLSTATWAGFGNYAALVLDPILRDSFIHVFILLIFFAIIPILLGLIVTAAMTRSQHLPFRGFFETIMFLPQVVTTVAIATIWVAIYAPNGLINQILGAIGLSHLEQPWLGSFDYALLAVGFIGIWFNLGLCVVLFVSGVGAIPREIFESSRLDGAGPVREFVSITLPDIRGQLASALILTVISALKTFDLIYVATSGGPGNSTTVPAYSIYNLAFNQGQVGTASALGVVLTAIISVVTVAINRIQPTEVA